MPRSDVVRLAGPGLVVRGGPECGSVGLGHGTHVLWALTVPDHWISDTCSLIAWTIDLLSNILWEGRLLQRPKQLKIINHKVNKTMRWARALLCHLHMLSETSGFPLMKSWRARCIQIICGMNNVIFHWLITINIYVKKICAVLVYRCNFHFNFTQCNMILLL